jgi:hypothetical protein
MSEQPPPPKEEKVILIKFANELKMKLGLRKPSNEPGFIDPKKIKEADAYITKLCETSNETIGKNLDALIKTWDTMRETPQSAEREKLSTQIFTYSHEIKDIGSLCGYALIAYFAESLRDYIAQTSLNLKNQQVIIQAHIDAMKTVHKNNLRENGGAAAEELKRIVKIAIEKYH